MLLIQMFIVNPRAKVSNLLKVQLDKEIALKSGKRLQAQIVREAPVAVRNLLSVLKSKIKI